MAGMMGQNIPEVCCPQTNDTECQPESVHSPQGTALNSHAHSTRKSQFYVLGPNEVTPY